MVKHGKLRAFTPELDKQIAAEYEAGSSIWALANKHGVAYQTVDKALRRCNVVKRPVGKEIRWASSPEQEAEVVALYAERMSVKAIARYMCTRDSKVTETLHKHGVEIRRLGGAKRGGGRNYLFTEEEAEALGREYVAGDITLRDLAAKHGTNENTMRNTLRRVGVHTRYLTPQRWTPTRCQWLIEQFDSGRPLEDVARELGVEVTTVKHRLNALRVSIQTPRHARRRVGQKGYVEVLLLPGDEKLMQPMANGWVLEHRIVMARALNRPLSRHEQVHHINGDRSDNRLANLQLRQGYHGPGVVMVCNSCGSHDITATQIASPEASPTP